MDTRTLNLTEQIKYLDTAIALCPKMEKLLQILNQFGGTEFWVAGDAICKTVWNHQLACKSDNWWTDVDIVCFVPVTQKDGWLFEDIKKHLTRVCKEERISINIVNFAEPPEEFKVVGIDGVIPFKSITQGVMNYPAVCECVAIRRELDGLKIIAPMGLQDLLNTTYRINDHKHDLQWFNRRKTAVKHDYPFIDVIG